LLEKRLTQMIEFRHGVIHRFEFDLSLTREDMAQILDDAVAIIDTLVDYLEHMKRIKNRD